MRHRLLSQIEGWRLFLKRLPVSRDALFSKTPIIPNGNTPQVEALKMEVAELRAARAATASFNLPSAGDMLQSLGLDKWKDDRLRGPKVSALV